MEQSNTNSAIEASYFDGGAADQTLYGMAAVTHLLSGEGNSANTLRTLFGSAICAPGTALGGRPYELFERFGREHWSDLEALIDEHMLFPLYRAIAAPSRYESAFAAAKRPGRSMDDLRRLGWNVLKRGPSQSGLRMCPLCVKDDAGRGPALWRLSHQIPWVTHCWRHGTALIAKCAKCGADLAHRRRLRMPRLACHLCKMELIVEGERNDFETHVACFYLEIQRTRGEYIGPEARLAAYRARAHELGYPAEANATRAFFSETESSLTHKRKNSSVIRLAQPRDWNLQFGALFRQPRQLISRAETLFLPWLFNSWSDVLAYSKKPPVPYERAKRAKPKPGGGKTEPPELIEARLLAAMKRGATPSGATIECRVSPLLGKYVAHRFGHPHAKRKPDYEATQTMISKFIEMARSGCSTAEIMATLNLPRWEPSAIRRVYYREIGDHVAARRAFQLRAAKDQLRTRVAEGGSLTLDQLKQQLNWDYSFVQANDPAWLKELLTSADVYAVQRRANAFIATDAELLVLLRELNERWLLHPPTFRKCKGRIRQELEASSWMLQDIGRLPKSQALLESMIETAAVANTRRVKASLGALPVCPTVREISSHSGVDFKYVKAVLEIITNDECADSASRAECKSTARASAYLARA